jgi:hypothetical protein
MPAMLCGFPLRFTGHNNVLLLSKCSPGNTNKIPTMCPLLATSNAKRIELLGNLPYAV